MATIKSLNLPYNHHHHPRTTTSHRGTTTPIRAVATHPSHQKHSIKSNRFVESLSHLLHLDVDHMASAQGNNIFQNQNWEEKLNTPTMSPKEEIASRWRDFHGSCGWEDLLDPLHPCVRREIVKYGEFAQATYDAFDFDSYSEYCGSCRYNPHKIFDKLGLTKHGYDVTKYIYAMSQIELPRWLERSHVMDAWSKHSNWMGYVAVSDDVESKRIGRRDIVVAWRGTVSPSEWYEDMQRQLELIGDGSEAKVEHGFLAIYKSKCKSTRYNKSSASEQVMEEVKKLVKMYKAKGEEVSLTITGHSLGGALALLNAHEASIAFPILPISVISFGAPRVGNKVFKEELHERGVKTLRVVIKQDLVPHMPGLVFNEGLQRFEDLTGTLKWVYHHVGVELELDVVASPYLKKGGSNFVGFHSLETYLHLVDGYEKKGSTFRSDARRDVALVNKGCDMLVEELKIPHCWHQLRNKGLELNAHGRWLKPKRDLEDIPSPTIREGHTNTNVQIDNYEKDQPAFSY